MKELSIVILLIAYLPLFFYSGDNLRGLFNDLYGILSAIGISLFYFGEFKEKKKWLFVPIASLFSVIGIIFFLNTILDEFYSTYKPVLLIILSVLLCYLAILIKFRKST